MGCMMIANIRMDNGERNFVISGSWQSSIDAAVVLSETMLLYLSNGAASLLRFVSRNQPATKFCGCQILARPLKKTRIHQKFYFSRGLSTSSLFSKERGIHSSSFNATGQTGVVHQRAKPVPTEDDFPDDFPGGRPTPRPVTEFRGMNTDFPCVTKNKQTGPEPQYDRILSGFKTFTTREPFPMKYNNAVLPELTIAYETWGELNERGDNAVLIHAGLSASSHARSHEDNPNPGWWEKFVGPGCAVDTDRFFVICTNTLGSCYGTSGPATLNPLTSKPYGTTFPLVSVEDMVRSQFRLLDHLGIQKLHGSVGSSLGGMNSLMAAALFPERVGRLVSISSCAQSHPSSIAMRYLQRKTIMTDPNWKKGHYYDSEFPKMGMKLAREIATLTYRSGPEWDERFGRQKIEGTEKNPSLCPTYLIESYLEHQGEMFSTKFDPNSLLYISKAMDLFDISEGYDSLKDGLNNINCPVMVIGVQTDILFPIWQQRELAKALQETGNDSVTFYELNSLYGHDTFLLDLNGVGAAVKGFLETEMKETGWLNKHKKKVNKDRILY